MVYYTILWYIINDVDFKKTCNIKYPKNKTHYLTRNYKYNTFQQYS